MGEYDADLRIFPDEFVPNVQASKTYQRWAKSSPGDRGRWEAFRDALLAGQEPSVPSMSTTFGRALVAAGKEHMSISQLVGAVTNPYPPAPAPPSPPIGTPIQYFSDVVSAGWGQPFINRWYTTGNIYQPPPSSGGWSSIGGQEAVQEISTVHGPGFRFLVTNQMQGFSAGASAVMLHDQDHWVDAQAFLGTTFDLTFKIMFPASGNAPAWPQYADWNALFEWVGDSNVSNQIGIEGIQNRLYCRSYGHIWNDKALGPTIAKDQWYTVRWVKTWAYDASGYTGFWVDGVQYADWTGASLEPGTSPQGLQFGFYSPVAAGNQYEIHMAEMSLA